MLPTSRQMILTMRIFKGFLNDTTTGGSEFYPGFAHNEA